MNESLDTSPENFRYAGFISYSQKDKVWAQRIHRALEAYRLPTGIASDQNKKKGLGRFFRDDDELAGAPSLGDALESSLNASAALIVVCSPNSARSKWVDAEIRKFKSRGPSAKVLAIIVDGEPDSDDPEVMCFAPSMLYKVDNEGELTDEPDEPLAPDANKEPFNRLIVRLVAGLLGLEFDTLWQREQRRLRKLRIQMAVAAVLATVGIGVGSMMYLEAERQRALAEQEQLRTESVNLAISSQTAMDENKVDDALVYALDALPTDLENPNRPITPEAIAALKRVMAENHAVKIVAQYEQGINELHLLPDGRIAIWFDDGKVRVVDNETGTVDWQSTDGERLKWLGSSALAASINSYESLDSEGLLQVQHKVKVRDLATGKIQNQLESNDRKWWVGPFAALSPSGSRLMITRSVSASSEEKNDLGIWQVPGAGEDPTPKLVKQIEGPVLNDNDRLEKIFIDDTTLLLSWGEKRQTMALWQVADNTLQTFSKPNAPLVCSGQLEIAKDSRRDKIALSKDRQIITHARPIKDAGWCVELWNAKGLNRLQPQIIEENRIGSVDALAEDTVVVARHGRSLFSRASMQQYDKEPIKFAGCKKQRSDILEQFKLDETTWLIEPNSKFSACVNGNDVQTYWGPHYASQDVLYGHQGAVSAVAYDQESARLYSAGNDGQLRVWGFKGALDNKVAEGNIISMVSNTELVAILYKDPATVFNTGFNMRIYEANGTARTIAIPHEIKTAKDDKFGFKLAMRFVNEGKSIAITETSTCRYNCPSSLTWQVTLYRTSDGTQLAQVDNLFGGHFLANFPISHALSKQGKHIALPRRDGTVIELDTATGEIIRTHRIQGRSVHDVVYTLDNLWILADDGEEDPYKRNVSLVKTDDKGVLTTVWKQRAQSGNLYGSSTTRKAFIELSLTHDPKVFARYAILDENSHVREMSIPKSHRNAGARVDSVYYYADDSRIALLFSDNGAAPLELNLENHTSKVLAASLPASMSDPWRVEDPLQRVVGSVDNDKLFFQPLPEQAPLCPDIVGQDVDAAGFSPDGKLLAVSESYEQKLTVYDLKSCTSIYETDVGASNNSKLKFVDEKTLWAITKDKLVRVIKMPMEPELIHEQAKQLRKALGLMSAIKPSESKN